MKNLKKIAISFSFISSSFAADLSGDAIAQKCYLKLTRQRHPIFQKFKNYTKAQAIAYCKDLVDAPATGGDGRVVSKNQNIASDSEAKMIAETLYDFHRTWFKSTNWSASVPGDAAGFAYAYHDTYLPAGYVTRAFLEDRNYESILTGTAQPYTLRRNGSTISANQGGVEMREGCATNGGANNFKVTGISVGLFDGFREDNRARGFNSCHNDWETKIGESYGGGILGSIPYIALNLGFNPFIVPVDRNSSNPIYDGTTSDGGLRVGRRWSKAVFSEILCRELPAMRIGDVTSFVQTGAQNGNNYPTFRAGVSCLSCHQAMDPMAGAIRNIVLWNMGNDGTYIAKYRGNLLPTADERPARDPDFHKRPPTGKLMFRSISGNLVDVPVNGLDELGAAITNTPDFYACAASRYLNYLSGVNIPLVDPNGAKDSSEMVYLKSLSNEFKSHQNIKKLLKAIFESTYFTSTK